MFFINKYFNKLLFKLEDFKNKRKCLLCSDRPNLRYVKIRALYGLH